ncbi:O-antigen/teichoic acid export membrane protein [Tenacibaculum adriaticum]|uniref:O-antigen/teichoic acid export membrane protein n=1 Tax=Tenacibaculum adriaticum TaxID=413713 RepID=A0A5S5DVM2_9FLAO|nr:MATE family efflux transporter [Tenacibaculum adriaticum]TYP99901.1 O-antigen/teichoic acid export membrane protein [Tenacibaculum adriaticum]
MIFPKKHISNPRFNLLFKTLSVLILRVLGVTLLFGVTLFLTNNFSASLIGKYDFVRSFLLVFGSLTLLGTEHSILYFAGKLNGVKEKQHIKSIYIKMISLIFMAYLVLTTIVFLLNKEFINSFFNDLDTYFLIFNTTMIIFFYSISILNFEVLRTLNYTTLSELYRNIIKYLPFFLGAILINYLEENQLLINVYLIGFILIGIISTYQVFNKFKKSAAKPNNYIGMTEVFKKSYPMAISGMAFFLLQSIDVLFLKKYTNNQTIAYYSVAVKFVLIIALVINAININIASKIAELYTLKKIIELKKILNQGTKFMFIGSLILCILIVTFSSQILSFFGEEYIASETALKIMVLSQGVCSFFGSTAVYLNMTGKQKQFQNILTVAVLINFILNFYLIPIYGMVGAAISFSFSLFFWNILSVIIIYKKDRILMLGWL